MKTIEDINRDFGESPMKIEGGEEYIGAYRFQKILHYVLKNGKDMYLACNTIGAMVGDSQEEAIDKLYWATKKAVSRP